MFCISASCWLKPRNRCCGYQWTHVHIRAFSGAPGSCWEAGGSRSRKVNAQGLWGDRVDTAHVLEVLDTFYPSWDYMSHMPVCAELQASEFEKTEFGESKCYHYFWMKNIFSLECISDCSIGYRTFNILEKFLQYVCGMYLGLVVENKMKTSGFSCFCCICSTGASSPSFQKEEFFFF